MGTILVYSTFLGGTTEDLAEGIAVSSQGIAYVTAQRSRPTSLS